VKRRRIIFYTDERNDEFSRAQITPRVIDGSYIYDHDSAWKHFTHFFWYRIVATPIAFLYTKLVFGHKIVNRELLRAQAEGGRFIYGNHTQDIADAFIPNLLHVKRETYVIVHPNNVSMPILGKVTPSLGALPLPDDMSAYRNFLRAVEKRITDGHQVVIYPEAHIWPYYTEIRSFSDDSFLYPVKYGVAAFCFTNVYRRRRWGRRPRIVTYIDGPFYPREDLPMRERRRDLRDRVYACMCERAKMSDVRWIQYIKKEKTDG
jgi:1-acyl-sn-glycerol-3-phosphate acyltransferase